ncbi:MAG: VWA domain-containing protein [Nitrososphaera sp.]|uniref:Putative von Willebrand factor type A n=1 Tax=Nitrososphaera gargensis (strain Ga9.2) TaxID=1237085 RepID=K0INC1_NITGG|nr:VWA domain-containing protein [Candidatus Nitrososphaera gargensis]AFU59114.1 putative von Willebrand factor type A [Candidatus Nitrososphaera gargensis Ga9.2]
MDSHSSVPGSKKFVYFPLDKEGQEQKQQSQGERELPRDVLDKLLKALGREALREKTPSLQELEQALQGALLQQQGQEWEQQQQPGSQTGSEGETDSDNSGIPLVRQLMNKGYLKDSPKWLSSKGFNEIGNRMLSDVMKALKAGEYGMHETRDIGSGSLVLDTSKKYEPGDDIRLLNVPKSLLNTIQRMSKDGGKLKLPLQIDVEDFEEYETMQDVRVAVVYCIDLSSTMRYSSMYGDMSRIEAAKRALWSLYLLNRKFFPSDSVYIVGFGALASKVAPNDIPYLKTFEPGSDFLHYTNYQAAFRLASKMLQKDGALNKRIVLVTDGHPSACFIDDKSEQDKILSQRPYSHFYTPDRQTLDTVKQENSMNLDIASGELVYLCYRYRQVDQYIGERTIVEAKKVHSQNIDIDTIMVSEEDSLLGYVNEMEKYVKGRSYYINPADIDKVLLTDYLNNKKQQTIRAHSQW